MYVYIYNGMMLFGSVWEALFGSSQTLVEVSPCNPQPWAIYGVVCISYIPWAERAL